MWKTLNLSEVKQKLKTNYQYGLSNEEIEKRFQEYGENKLDDKKKENIIIKFLKQFNDFMIIILIIASIISAVVAKLDGSNDYLDSIIIIAIVVFNAIMGIIQEAKAEKSLEALQKMTAPVVKVKREGKIKEIKSIRNAMREHLFFIGLDNKNNVKNISLFLQRCSFRSPNGWKAGNKT